MRVPISNVDQDTNQTITLPLHTEKPPPSYSASSQQTQKQEAPGQLTIDIHPSPTQDGVLIKIQPPRAPLTPSSSQQQQHKYDHVPCDIVLVIDVSGSMATAANVPGEDEETGLSVLDLVRHAARTILQTMDSRDRLGIVTFGFKSSQVQELVHMTEANKATAVANIDSMVAAGATNLWHGILHGFRLFSNAPRTNNVPAIMVLTDGLPNHMCPSAGYIPKLRTLMPFPGSIHTFGFGYRLRSGLLKSIAEVGGGNYAFIPDAGMIGTVFVNAVANLQATFATAASLRLEYASSLALEHAMGASVEQTAPQVDGGRTVLDIQLGNIQYGQSRDVLLRVKSADPSLELLAVLAEKTPDQFFSASLTFTETIYKSAAALPPVSSRPSVPPTCVSVTRSILSPSGLSAAEFAYHESRARICSLISSFFPISPADQERRIVGKNLGVLLPKMQRDIAALIAELPARQYDDALNQSLMEDLAGEQPRGQVSLAVSDESYFSRWGIHYLLSYLNAHTRQICNSFKDAGPLQYGVDSPLFLECRTRLDTAFDNLPPPVPTLPTIPAYRPHNPDASTGSRPKSNNRGASTRNTSASYNFSMSRYNRSSGPCFAASTPVELASGASTRISRLRRGTVVRTPSGPRRVAMVLKTPVQNQLLCRVGALLVTPWHPVSLDGGKTWCFPARVADNPVLYSGAVYSVLLQRDHRSESHAIRVAGTWGVTLGHGVLGVGDDVRAHDFLGSWTRVARSLAALGPDRRGLVLGGGVRRNEQSGRVCGFRAAADGKEQALVIRSEGIVVVG